MAYENTAVTVEKSQGEIRKLLNRHGANSFRFSEGEDSSGVWWVGVEFIHEDHLVRLMAPLKQPDESWLNGRARRARTKSRRDIILEHNEQEARRIWRVIVWSIKSRMVAVEEGLETFEQAFLSHLVDPGSQQTVWSAMQPHVESGRMRMGGGGLPELGAG